MIIIVKEGKILMSETKNEMPNHTKDNISENKKELPKIAEVKVSKKDQLVFFGTCHCSNGGC